MYIRKNSGSIIYSRVFGKILFVLLLTLIILLTACSEETSSQNSEEIASLPRLNLTNCVSSNVSAKGSLTPNKTVPLPQGFRIFVSNIYPYALSYPDNWTIRENQSAGNLKSDLIVAEYKDNSRAFMFVLSEKLDNPNTDSAAYFDSKLKELNATQKSLPIDQQGERIVADNPAYVISFNVSQPIQTQSIQITFVSQGRGWVISYSSSPDLGQKYCGQFVQILDTFALTNLSK